MSATAAPLPGQPPSMTRGLWINTRQWDLSFLTLSALLGQLIPMPVAIVVALAFRLALTASEGVWALTISWLTRSRRQIAQKD